MNRDTNALATALGAFLEVELESAAPYYTEIFRFNDDRLRFELHIHPNMGTAFLAADPVEPIQGCPMLEFSFRCTDIAVGVSAYSDDVAVCFYDGDDLPNDQRLTMTWVPSGYWYVWANANEQPYPKSGE